MNEMLNPQPLERYMDEEQVMAAPEMPQQIFRTL